MKIIYAGEYRGHQGAVYCLSHGHENGQFYSSGGDGLIVRWTFGSEEGKVVANAGEPVFSLLSAPGPYLFAGTQTGKIYRIDSDGQSAPRRMDLHRNAVYCMLYRDGRIYTASGDGVLGITDAASMQLLEAHHLGSGGIRSMAFLQDSHLLIGCRQGRLFTFDANGGKPELLKEIPGARTIFSLAADEAEGLVYIGSMDARLRVLDYRTGEMDEEGTAAHRWTINDLLWIPESRMLVSASRDRTMRFWKGRTPELLAEIAENKYQGHQRSVNKLHWLGEEGVLLSGSDSALIKAWKTT